MTTKKCSYKGCGSFTNSTHTSSATFYAFPKHPDRLKLWLKLGGNLNEREIQQTSRYFCSKHFDESKYVASNPRRKQLLSTAVPYPCEESSHQEDMNMIEEYQCVVSSVHSIEEEYDASNSIKIQEDELSEQLTNEVDDIDESVETFETYEDYQRQINCPTDFEETIEVERKPLKRKLEHVITKPSTGAVLQAGPSSKRTLTIVSNRPTSTINAYQAPQIEEKDVYEECGLDSLLPESNNVTTFIFKGEEYVQMPKEQYNREKIALINKIRTYEEVLRNVKQIMDGIKF